jgi:hypothetical protein
MQQIKEITELDKELKEATNRAFKGEDPKLEIKLEDEKMDFDMY